MLLFNNTIVNYFRNFVSRDNIESAHSDHIAVLRSQYSDEEKEIIKSFSIARTVFNRDTSSYVQELNGQMVQEETDHEGPSGNYDLNFLVYAHNQYIYAIVI